MEDHQEVALHPWSVLFATLSDLDSDEVVRIASLAGLSVDWSLDGQEAYSHKTRKRVYRPRIDAAFDILNKEEKLRVAFRISKEILAAFPEFAQTLNERLLEIGWSLDGNQLRPATAPVVELFFTQDAEHDAYIYLRSIIQSACKSLDIVDPYIDGSVLTLVATCENPLRLRILTFHTPGDFAQEMEKFQRQYTHFEIELCRSRVFHDRFLIVDGQDCYHLGASIKDAGKRAFMVSKIADPKNKSALMTQLQSSFSTAD